MKRQTFLFSLRENFTHFLKNILKKKIHETLKASL